MQGLATVGVKVGFTKSGTGNRNRNLRGDVGENRRRHLPQSAELKSVAARSQWVAYDWLRRIASPPHRFPLSAPIGLNQNRTHSLVSPLSNLIGSVHNRTHNWRVTQSNFLPRHLRQQHPRPCSQNAQPMQPAEGGMSMRPALPPMDANTCQHMR